METPINTGSENHNLWHVGVLSAMGASFVGALGDNLVRLSYVKEANRENKIPRPLLMRPLWIWGEILTIFCNPILILVALKFAAASIVVPFGGLHIFWNLILCSQLLNEKFSKAEFAGSLIILIGIIVVVIFGTHEMPGYTLDQIIELLKQTNFIFYAVFCVFCSIFLFYFCKSNFKLLLRNAFIKNVPCVNPQISSSFLEQFSLSALSGLFGGNGNLLAKACIESLANNNGYNSLFRTEAIIIILATLVVSTLQVLTLTVALSRYEAKFVVPMANSILVAIGSSGGVILFKESSEKDPIEMIIFSIGICSVIMGILILMSGTLNLNIIELNKDEERFNLIQSEIEVFEMANHYNPELPITDPKLEK